MFKHETLCSQGLLIPLFFYFKSSKSRCYEELSRTLQNWWNSSNMAEYYRNWNLVVHDWLYAYIYKDVAQVNIEENETKQLKKTTSEGYLSTITVSGSE